MSRETGHNGLLHNYRELRERVDRICREIETEFGAHLSCREGCDSCCRHLSLFPVEATALAAAVDELPPARAEHIRARARRATPDGPCPLLDGGSCLLYAARPLICLTHGLPLLAELDGAKSVDFCPLNFKGITSLPGNAVIDLDRLNTALAAINALFVAEAHADTPPEQDRITIAEALTKKF